MIRDNPFKKIPTELLLILAATQGDINKTQKLLQQSIDWGLLVKLAVHHRVYPLVYKLLSQLNSPAVPEDALSFLRNEYQHNAIKALSLTGETVRIINSLESHGVNALVLKGAPLASRLYGDIAIRPSKDIDILIPPEAIEKARSILENEGYLRVDTEHNLSSRHFQIFAKAFPDSIHFDFWHSKKKLNVELHWKPTNRGYVFPPISINRIKMAGSQIPVFSDEQLLLYLILHGAGHAWLRLRWLVDISHFIQNVNINWEKTLSLAKHIGMRSLLHQTMYLINLLLELPVPAILQSSMDNDRSARRLAYLALNLSLATADKEILLSMNKYTKFWQFIYDLNVHKGWKSRLKFFLKPFGPTVNDIKLLILPEKLYLLYYIIRPFTFIGRRLRKLALGN